MRTTTPAHAYGLRATYPTICSVNDLLSGLVVFVDTGNHFAAQHVFPAAETGSPSFVSTVAQATSTASTVERLTGPCFRQMVQSARTCGEHRAQWRTRSRPSRRQPKRDVAHEAMEPFSFERRLGAGLFRKPLDRAQPVVANGERASRPRWLPCQRKQRCGGVRWAGL